jgi:hypothetical protein
MAPTESFILVILPLDFLVIVGSEQEKNPGQGNLFSFVSELDSPDFYSSTVHDHRAVSNSIPRSWLLQSEWHENCYQRSASGRSSSTLTFRRVLFDFSVWLKSSCYAAQAPKLGAL